jgi:hypothetical protein
MDVVHERSHEISAFRNKPACSLLSDLSDTLYLRVSKEILTFSEFHFIAPPPPPTPFCDLRAHQLETYSLFQFPQLELTTTLKPNENYAVKNLPLKNPALKINTNSIRPHEIFSICPCYPVVS